MNNLAADFALVRPQYEAFTTSLEGLIRSLLNSAEIEYFAIEARTKTLDSFDEKIQREDKQAKYAYLDDVTDLSGIRIIAYLQEDCDRICRLISDEFSVDEANSIKKDEELDPDKFGYLSSHYVVKLGPQRSTLREFAAFVGFKSEIQVRTLLQHTWSAIDWKFRYKEEREAPKPLRRRLFRISALLEAADNEFSAVRAEIEALRARYAKQINEGDLDIALNSESAASFFADSQIVDRVLDAAKKEGIRIVNRDDQTEAFNRLIGSATVMKISTIGELNTALNSVLPDARKFFAHLVSQVRKLDERRNPQLLAPAVVRYALMRNSTAAQRKEIMEKYKLASGYGEAIAEYIKALGKPEAAP
jgi:ppGpp synthetase/RelA/SpoT-type nucleotidyltranferase